MDCRYCTAGPPYPWLTEANGSPLTENQFSGKAYFYVLASSNGGHRRPQRDSDSAVVPGCHAALGGLARDDGPVTLALPPPDQPRQLALLLALLGLLALVILPDLRRPLGSNSIGNLLA